MKKKILKIILSGLLLIVALCINTNIIWIKPALFVVSYIIIGLDVIKEVIENIGEKNLFDENLLMLIATIGAIAIKEYPEAIAVMIFYTIGEIFEEIGEEKSRKSITDLMNIKPEFANVILSNGKIEKKNPERVKIGDTIIVKPGEKIPLDGEIIEGTSSLDTSALTGESMPREVGINSKVYSGCININGIITVKVEKEYKDSTVSKILELVENTSEKKAKTEKFITKFCKFYTPIVVIMAIAIFMFGVITKTETIYQWLYRSLTFLVISCPCALVISVPLSFFGGIGGSAKKGILVKGSTYMDTLAKLDTIVLDKTGTITKGNFAVQKILTNNISKEEFVKYVAIAEQLSNHPIAEAVKKLYNENVDTSRITELEEISGKGIKCKIDEENILVGNIKLMQENNVKGLEKIASSQGTTLYLAINSEYKGFVEISDEIKEKSKEAIKELKNIGISKIVMLTGDKKEEAERIAKLVGIKEYKANLLPTDKIEQVEKLIAKGEILAFVGDGINDSPVLARADVGIAMGGLGSDSAIEAADVVIMNDDLSKIPTVIKIAKKTIKIAKQNITFAILIKILILILSMLKLTSMWMAVFADVGVTLIVVLNSLRAMK